MLILVFPTLKWYDYYMLRFSDTSHIINYMRKDERVTLNKYIAGGKVKQTTQTSHQALGKYNLLLLFKKT